MRRLTPPGFRYRSSHSQTGPHRAYPHGVQTRYLIIAALITALVILGASLVWFLMGVL